MFNFDIRKLSWRDRAQLAAAATSLTGIAMMVGGAAIIPFWTHFGFGQMSDPARVVESSELFRVMDRARDVSTWGFPLMAAGGMIWAVISPSGTRPALWSRASSLLLWVAMIALMFGFRGKSLAEIGGLVSGKIAYASLAVASMSLVVQLVVRVRQRGAAPIPQR